MKKIILKYDGNSIYDINGLLIMVYQGLVYDEYRETLDSLSNIIALKNAGFSTEEILALNERKLIE